VRNSRIKKKIKPSGYSSEGKEGKDGVRGKKEKVTGLTEQSSFRRSSERTPKTRKPAQGTGPPKRFLAKEDKLAVRTFMWKWKMETGCRMNYVQQKRIEL